MLTYWTFAIFVMLFLIIVTLNSGFNRLNNNLESIAKSLKNKKCKCNKKADNESDDSPSP